MQEKNKELEATEERKRKAKQLELQRKEMARSGRGGVGPRTPSYPTYTPPSRPTVTDTYDSYEAEKNKSFRSVTPRLFIVYIANNSKRISAPKGKGMQLGKKSKTTDMFERVRGDLGAQAEESAPLVSNAQPIATAQKVAPSREPTSLDNDAIRFVINEQISARLSREGTVKLFGLKGDLHIKIADSTLTKVKLDLLAEASHGAQFRTHPMVDKALFTSSKIIQLKDTSKGFPVNNSVGVLRWSANSTGDTADLLPITFTVWVNKGSDESWTVTVEYELMKGHSLRDVAVTIPYATSEPAVSNFDAIYEVSGDSLEWTIGPVDETNQTGSFEFEAQAEDEGEFFPMKVRFSKTTPLINVDVSNTNRHLGVLC